jgi:apolipoprotein D and lipocalin family protein
MWCTQNRFPRLIMTAFGALLLTGCKAGFAPLATVNHVDLERFMGDWYVIANIPTFVEKGAHNAVESYRLDADGTIETTFTFRQDAFDGPLKTYRPRGFVRNRQSNADGACSLSGPEIRLPHHLAERGL